MLGYLGPKGTFSHQAAMEWSQGKAKLREFPTIHAAIKAVDSGDIDKAIVPIENSIEGSINTTLDALAFDVNLYITGEYVLKISQNLMIKKDAELADIKVVTSHPQPIGQSSALLSNELSHLKVEFADSTAAAAKIVEAGDGTIACIGSPNLAEMYNLKIAIPNCGDDDSNSTRFVIIEKKPCLTVTERDKTSVAFTLENKPGSLYSALELLAESKVNMTKIESRPVKTNLGTYVFLIDIDGNIDFAKIYFSLYIL